MSTTDFDAWLESNGPDDITELKALKDAVEQETWMPPYTAKRDGGRVLVTGASGDVLVLASSSAQAAFLLKLESLNGDTDLDIDDEFHFRRNIDSPHA